MNSSLYQVHFREFILTPALCTPLTTGAGAGQNPFAGMGGMGGMGNMGGMGGMGGMPGMGDPAQVSHHTTDMSV